jgi:transposase-like protein
MVERDACPASGAQHFKRNGHTHNGKQNHRCKDCGRQFVGYAENHLIAKDPRTLAEQHNAITKKT